MKRARKSIRISWAPAPNLCQVKLFLSEESPSKVGMKSQDHLQAKMSPLLPTSTNEYDDLPPGFESHHFPNQSKPELPRTSQIKWECPPQFALNYKWQVAAGEESKEKDNQKLRNMRVLEALYPRPSGIPPSPSVTFEVEKENYDDNLTPIIPIIPIEEEESKDTIPDDVAVTKHADMPTNLQSQNLAHNIPAAAKYPKSSSSNVPSSSLGKPVPAVSPRSEEDLAAAASSALAAALITSSDQCSLIDTDLLLRIFNDPTMIGNLTNQHRTAATTVSVSSKSPTVSGTTLKTDKPAISPDLVLTVTPTFRKPSVPSFRPVSGNSAATHSFALPIPTPTPTPSHPLRFTPTPQIHRPANKEIPPRSNVMLPNLNSYTPQPHAVVSSGVKRAAPLASVSSREFSRVALHSVSPNQVQVQSGTNGSASAKKDANYYKNLIRQHGSDKQDSQIGNLRNNNQDLKSVNNNIIRPILKTQKPCMYFSTPRGCRNGSNCPYQHDTSVQFAGGNALGTQIAKRMKLGPEIKGWV